MITWCDSPLPPKPLRTWAMMPILNFAPMRTHSRDPLKLTAIIYFYSSHPYQYTYLNIYAESVMMSLVCLNYEFNLKIKEKLYRH